MNFLYRIDRVLSQGKGRQIIWLAVFVCILLAIFWAIDIMLGYSISLRSMISLMLSPGEFYEDDHLGFQLIVNLIGLVLVSSMLISILSNIVENRVNQFTKGDVRYRFRNHLLFLGANDMLVDTIVGQMQSEVNPSKVDAIVVLTERDAEDVRQHLMAQIQDSSIRRRIIVLFGDRTRSEQLQSVGAERAQRIFLLGEGEEADHDTRNMLCLSHLRKFAEQSNRTMECYLLCNHLSTLRILQLQTEPLPRQLHLTVMNTLENWTQRVLVNGDGYPHLYSHPMTAEDNHYVHLVVLGGSQMAYSMVLTTAHVAHYPNYLSKGRRTRITMIAPNMAAHKDFLVSHYESLFRLSHWSINGEEHHPTKEYDFLDIEWEFLEGTSNTQSIRDQLVTWSNDPDQMLTLAVCTDDMKANLATALYLPTEITTHNVPVLVYQPSNDALAEWTKAYTLHRNIYPFGMRSDCYDDTFRRRLHWAQQANEAYEDNAALLNPSRVRKHWYDLKLTLQFSNLYSANYCYAVLRNVDPAYYAQLEHQRWMTERLLLGYKAMNKEQRVQIEHMSEPERQQRMDECTGMFYHPNIQPFDELTEESVHKDVVMTSCLISKM